MSKKHSPNVNFITNAGFLTEEMGYRLLHSEAIDEFNISFISIQPEVYEKMMPPLKFETVMDNILRDKWHNKRLNGILCENCKGT